MAETGAPTLEFIFAANVVVGPPLNLGDVGKGGRRIVPITGGEFSGPQYPRSRACRAVRTGRCCVATALPSWRRTIVCRPTTVR